MARAPSDPFFKVLYPRLLEEVDKRVTALTQHGSIVRGESGLLIDPVNTAMKYQKDIAVIETFQEIISLCFEIDREQFGGRYSENDDGDN